MMKKNLLFSLLFIFSAFSMIAQTTILDFETDATSTPFQYFDNGGPLEGSLNQVIANPDASGINTSSMVAEIQKGANGPEWAGVFSNPNPTTALDFTSANQVCMKVWSTETGVVSLKLEEGSQGDWKSTQDITEANTWVNVCFDANSGSDDDAAVVAAGGVYNKVVIFFDFGSVFDVDRTYYMDDLIVEAGEIVDVDITFSVDMNNVTEAFTTPHVSGTFNDWNGEANPLSDDDGDGVWTTTVTGIPSGAHQYKFNADNWNIFETFTGTETCTITTDGVNINRSLVASEGTVLPTVCYNSCYACGEAVNLTIELGTSGIAVSPEGVFIAGGGNFGNPGDFPLTDDDGDGVYSATFERPIGFESFYTFTNGACGDYSCKEDIAGQDCSNPDNFDDRFFGPLSEDLTISTCFGECTTDATSCSEAVLYDVTFQVDMTPYTDAFTTAFVSGSFNGWSGGGNPMTDMGDGIWEATIPLSAGPIEYKIQLDEWMNQEQFTEGDECTVTSDGVNTNRSLDVSADVTVCYVWNTCTSCLVNVNNITTDNSIFTAVPTLVQNSTVVTFGDNFTAEKDLTVVNMLGQKVATANLATGVRTYTLTLDNLENGLYFINVETEGKQQTQRIVVNR